MRVDRGITAGEGEGGQRNYNRRRWGWTEELQQEKVRVGRGITTGEGEGGQRNYNRRR